MNFRRVTTAQGLLYVGTEIDKTPFEIHKRKDGQYDLLVGGEVAGSFARLMDAKAEATRIERQILDELVAKRKAAIEKSGIRPGALVTVKGRKPADPVLVKHVTGNGVIELSRPDGGTFRRPVEDLTLVERSPEERAEITAEALSTLDADLDAHNARAAEINRPALSVRIGDEVELEGRPGHVIVTGIHGDGTATVRPEGGVKFIVKGSEIVAIRRTREEIEEAATARAVAGAEEEIRTAGGVSLGDRAEIADNEGVWVVNQILEVEGEFLYRLYRTSGAPGNRQTWRLGEEITLLTDEEAAEEFSEEEIVAERHDSAVRFKPEGEYEARQWPGPIFPKEFGPGATPEEIAAKRAVVANEAEGRKFREVEAKISAARVKVESLEVGDRIAYSGARGLEAWTVVGRRDQGGFVSLHVREVGDDVARWWTAGELASYVAGGQALLMRSAAPVADPDEEEALEFVAKVLRDESAAEALVEDRDGQPVLHLPYRGGSFELYATRVG